MTDQIIVDLVKFPDGTIDVVRTTTAFNNALHARIYAIESEKKEIAKAVSIVYDQYPGEWMTLSYLTMKVLSKMNVQPENAVALNKRIVEYIHSISRGESAILSVKKGVGFARTSDLV